MAANVLFKLLTAAQWEALTTPDEGTLYRVQKTGGGEDFYKGSLKLNNQAEISAAIAALTGSAGIASVSEGVVTLKAGIAEANGIVSNSSGSDITLAKAATTGAAEDISYDGTTSGLDADDLQEAVDALAAASQGGVASKTIWLKDDETVTTGYLKTYGLYQGANSPTAATSPATLIGKIDIPKDLVVTAGKVVTVESGVDSDGESTSVADGTYVKLTIANQTEKVYINVADLCDVYTAAASAAQVQLAISSTNEISATIVAGSIDTTELAAGAVTTAKLDDEAVTTAKIADENVTLGKLATAVQTSLGLADSAVQSVTASDPTTGTDGTFLVDGTTEVAIKGLGTAAFTAATAYDVSGAASQAESNAEAYADGLLTWQTVS